MLLKLWYRALGAALKICQVALWVVPVYNFTPRGTVSFSYLKIWNVFLVKCSAGPSNSSASAAFTGIRSRSISTMISLSAASFSMHTADTIAACSLSFSRTSHSANVVLKAFYQLICMAGGLVWHLTLIHVHRVNTWGYINCKKLFWLFQ